jgi:dCTP deaminase
MFLSSFEIQQAIEDREIDVSPSVASADMRPFGLRLHLANTFLYPQPGTIFVDGSSGNPPYRAVALTDHEPLVLEPGDFVLGSTVESVRLDSDIVGFLDGRSTLARLGLFVHAGSQIIDGTSITGRTITLEILNSGRNRLAINPGAAIAMLAFFRSKHASDLRYIHSQYEGQCGATAPRLVFD